MYVCVCDLRRFLSSLREKVNQARLTNIERVIQVFGN